MDVLPTDRALVVSALHRPRTLHRLVTTVAGRGYIVEDLRYTRSSEADRALVTLVVDAYLASRGVDHLCAAVARAPDVLWASPLSSFVDGDGASSRFWLDRYHVSSRSDAEGRWHTEAVVAAVVDGERHLAAGEADDPVVALTAAFGTLVDGIVTPGTVRLAVSDRWSSSTWRGHAFASAVVDGPGLHRDVVRVERNELSAAAAALSSAASVAVSGLRQRGDGALAGMGRPLEPVAS